MSTYDFKDKNNEILDLSTIPSIELQTRLSDLFELEGIDEYRDKNFNTYYFNGVPVPRVSNIFKECIGKEYLMFWAAKLGQSEFVKARNDATTIGSIVHEMIENLLINGTDLDMSYKLSPDQKSKVDRAYNNFKRWLDKLHSLGYNIDYIYGTEVSTVSPYYGGTIDLLARINGKNYIIDFKTSKVIAPEYIMQTCAYMWNVNNGYCSIDIHIDGIGIIRVDKEKDSFEDLFLNEYIPYQREILYKYTAGFGSLLSSYYHMINMNYILKTYKKQFKLEETLKQIK
jgi:hypothetical protein